MPLVGQSGWRRAFKLASPIDPLSGGENPSRVESLACVEFQTRPLQRSAGGDRRMSNLSGWDLLILAIAAYIAMVTLVRLMRRRRDEEVARLQVQVAVQLRRKRAAERQERKQQAARARR